MTVEYTEIYPKIYVYHNSIKDPNFFLNQSLSQYQIGWKDWSIFGRYIGIGGKTAKYKSFPTWEEFKKSIDLQENQQLSVEYVDKFYHNSKHYIENNPIVLNEWAYESSSLCEYDITKGHDGEFSMAYHSDFVVPEKNWPGLKFEISVTTYLNDDYDGGELCFAIDNDLFSYKPKAGDMIIFPSRPPYFHGVRKHENKNRYMIRGFWLSSYEGSPEWHEGLLRYGKEEWEKMQRYELEKYTIENIPAPSEYASSYSRDNERLNIK